MPKTTKFLLEINNKNWKFNQLCTIFLLYNAPIQFYYSRNLVSLSTSNHRHHSHIVRTYFVAFYVAPNEEKRKRRRKANLFCVPLLYRPVLYFRLKCFLPFYVHFLLKQMVCQFLTSINSTIELLRLLLQFVLHFSTETVEFS